MNSFHLAVLAMALTAYSSVGWAAEGDPSGGLAQVEDFAQTHLQQCDDLAHKTDRAFGDFEQSPQYAEIQRIKADYQARTEKLLQEMAAAGELTAELNKKAEALESDYDRQIKAQEDQAALHQLNQLYLQTAQLEKQYTDMRSQALVWCLLSDQVAAQKSNLAGLEARQAGLEARAAEIEDMFKKDPELARQNQALLGQAKALLAESSAKLAQARQQYRQSVEQARKLTDETDDAKAVSSVQNRVAAFRKMWNLAKIKLAAIRAKLRESLQRSINATVGSFSGQVQVRRADGPFAAAKANDRLLPGDAIRTGPDGQARVTLTDGSVIQLGPRSNFELDAKEASTGLLKSGMLWLDGAIKSLAKRRFRVLTPTSVAAVRGTDVVCIGDEKRTVVIVGSGEVELASKDGGKAITVAPGTRAILEKGKDSPIVEPVKNYEETLAELFPDI